MSLNIQGSQTIKAERTGFFSKVLSAFSPREKFENVTRINEDEARKLFESICSAKRDWDCANANFEYASDEEAIDYYTYKIKACEVRYVYLIKKAKEMGIRFEHVDLPMNSFE